MKFHHVGYVVESIDQFLAVFPHEKVIKDCRDETQEARLLLLDTGSDAFIELIEPSSADSRLYPQIERSLGGINHVCFIGKQNEIEDQVEKLGLLKVFGPVRAPLFANQKVEFYVNHNMSLIEFLYE